MVKAVIFDLDDTLISETEYIKSGYEYIAKLLGAKYEKNGVEIFELLMELYSKSPKNVFNRLLDTLGIYCTNKNIIELVEEYRNHLPEIEFYNDVLPCLEFLLKKKIKIGVITDGYAKAQRQKLIAVKANNYFDEVIVTDELGREFWKPHPRPFEAMKDKLNVNFEEMVYVGDNPEKDFFISTVYPIKTIRINRNGVHSQKNYLNGIQENYLIHKLSELEFLF
jgi:putative hydrolase of the HAD superfamily